MRSSSLLLLVGTNERGDCGREVLGIDVDGKALGRAGQTRGAHLRARAAPADDYDPRRALRRRDRRGGDQAAAAKLAVEEADVGPLAGVGRSTSEAHNSARCLRTSSSTRTRSSPPTAYLTSCGQRRLEGE